VQDAEHRIDVAARLAAVRSDIERAARRFGREPGAVRLLAVSKTQPAEVVGRALETGQRLFGENRVQEAAAKWPGLRERYPDAELHLIGALQTNKARDAARLFDAIQTLDRERLAEALAEAFLREGRRPRLLVQVNTGEEPQKAGVPPRGAAAFVARARETHGLDIAGLMCIPPVEDAPGPHFALLAKLAAEAGLPELSMGMSGDYATAIRFGATYVRVGSAIFGERDRADRGSVESPEEA